MAGVVYTSDGSSHTGTFRVVGGENQQTVIDARLF
jgi:hypothetical protein